MVFLCSPTLIGEESKNSFGQGSKFSDMATRSSDNWWDKKFWQKKMVFWCVLCDFLQCITFVLNLIDLNYHEPSLKTVLIENIDVQTFSEQMHSLSFYHLKRQEVYKSDFKNWFHMMYLWQNTTTINWCHFHVIAGMHGLA